MTYKMAAGQPKKRLANSNLQEHCKGKKKKKPGSSDYVLNLRHRINLEWDDSQKKAFAKKELVGISWTHMAPYVAANPEFLLADVLSVPQELFSLENLMEVLSYEAWTTCLSESERQFLSQFLPSGTDAEQAVHSLLAGENLHFGNPFLKWSASLPSGNLHPDNVFRMEQQFRASKKAYYSELNHYHTNMIEVLKKWKERWSSCKDPEVLRKGITMTKQETVLISPEKAKIASNSKREMPHKIRIRNGDTAKYMSYIKISKKQYELVKVLFPGDDGILPKSLNRVVGDIKELPVYPYEAFLKEERNRFHEHWLQLINKDLPVAYQIHVDKKLHRKQLMTSLGQELSDRTKLKTDQEEMGNLESPREVGRVEDAESEDSEGEVVDVTGQDDTNSLSNPTEIRHLERIPSLNSQQEELIPMDQEAPVEDIVKPAENSPVLSRFFGENNTAARDIMEPMGRGMWHDVSIRDYPSTLGIHRYPSSNELSLGQPPYASRNHQELPLPFPNELGMMNNNLTQPGLQLMMANNSFSEPSQLGHQFQGQQLMNQRQAREEEVFMHPVINHQDVYPTRRYPMQPHVNGGWFPEANNGWSMEGGGGADGSLFSVFSDCRKFHDASEQERDFVGGGRRPNDNPYYYLGQAKNSSSSQDATAAAPAFSMPWINYTHQNSSLRDSTGKPFLRSWNQ